MRMYKNHEGYPDPTQGTAINGVRWEELQRMREKQHNLKRGEIITLRKKEREEGSGETKIVQQRVRILELYKNVVLIENSYGIRSAPSYWLFEQWRKK